MNKLPQALCLGCRRDAHGRSSTAEIEHAAFPGGGGWSLLGDRGTLLETEERLKEIERAIEEIYKSPLTETAKDTVNRQIRTGIEDQELADLVLALREEDRLVVTQEAQGTQEPQILCSLGLVASAVGAR